PRPPRPPSPPLSPRRSVGGRGARREDSPHEMPTRKMGPGAGATQGSPSDRLDDESGAVVHRRTRRLTVATAVAAHLIGTGVVLVLLVFVLPVPPEFEGWTPGSARL